MPDHPHLAPGRGKGRQPEIQILAVSAAFICVRIRARPFGTTGKKNPATCTPRSASRRHALRQHRIAQHHRHDRMLSRQKRNPQGFKPLPPVRAFSHHLRPQIVAPSTMSSAASPAATTAGGSAFENR
jgi:hypothetical protein